MRTISPFSKPAFNISSRLAQNFSNTLANNNQNSMKHISENKCAGLFIIVTINFIELQYSRYTPSLGFLSPLALFGVSFTHHRISATHVAGIYAPPPSSSSSSSPPPSFRLSDTHGF
ncbi:hypothetical protein BD289DRAFT_236840 [Coniella lustricola]|uniref:Uncharacterized protein n=1 Tax=Coniella lustricola TaxID=2025994 RepID=A0A2T3A9R3_9PEZI|nr:hypothetical protein BD289DRAFT_236840 [Coniella lustricola]